MGINYELGINFNSPIFINYKTFQQSYFIQQPFYVNLLTILFCYVLFNSTKMIWGLAKNRTGSMVVPKPLLTIKVLLFSSITPVLYLFP